MDVVIPLGKGSLCGNLELKYCLRGIEKYLFDVQNVFIVGSCPAFLKDVIHIQKHDNDSRSHKEQNIFAKVDKACRDKRVSNDFYFFNDDHFLLRPFDGRYYHCGRLSYHIEQVKFRQSYFQTLMNTYVLLKGGNNYDVHCPVVFNKERFLHSVSTCSWHMDYGYAMKSVYCNMNQVPGHFIPDLKIKMNLGADQITNLIKGRPFFSTGDTAMNEDMKRVLQKLYPDKSQYEL